MAQAGLPNRGFASEPPVVTAILLCEGVGLTLPSQRAVISCPYDFVVFSGPPTTLAAAIYVALNGVTEPFNMRFDVVVYPDDKPLGVHSTLGTVPILVPSPSRTTSAALWGTFVLPVEKPSTIDIIVYGNDQLLGQRSFEVIDLLQPPPPGPPQPGPPKNA